MCDIKEIELLFDNKINTVNEAIVKLSTTTALLEKSVTQMEKNQSKLYDVVLEQVKLSSGMKHLQKEVDENKISLNRAFDLVREEAEKDRQTEWKGKQWLFTILLNLFSVAVGTVGTIIAFRFKP